MHSYFSSATTLYVCLCVCVFACLSRVFICFWTASECSCVHCPTVSAEKWQDTCLPIRSWLSKTGMKLWWKRKKNYIYVWKKKKRKKPRDISILAPCFPQAAGRRLQNGSTPCHRVGSALSKCLWMENRRKSFLPSPLFPPLFFFLSHSLLLGFPLLPFRPSFIALWKGISSSPARLSMNAAFTPLSPSVFLSVAGAQPELSVSVRHLPVTRESILHWNVMSISWVLLSEEQYGSWYLLTEASMICVVTRYTKKKY